MNEESMLKPALIGGVLLGVLSGLPLISLFNCVCCAWVIGGGILASYLYVKDSPIPVTLGRGVALGLLTGVIGAIVHALFSIPLFLVARRSGMGPLEQIREVLERVPNARPETLEALRSLSGKGGIGLLFAVGFIFILVIYGIMAMAGGAIGVAIFEKRKPTAGPPNMPAYEPPQNPPPSPNLP